MCSSDSPSGEAFAGKKAGVKPTQLPVTVFMPQVSAISEIIAELREDSKLAVYDARGAFSFWADAAAAARLLRSGGFKILRTPKRIRGLMATNGELQRAALRAEVERIRRPGAGDSHRRETYTNPAGVWTIDRVRDDLRPLFSTVIEECRAAA